MLPSVVPLYMERVTAEVAVSHKVLGIAKLLSYQLLFEPANRIPVCGHPSPKQERKTLEVSDTELLRAKKFRVVRRTETRDAGMLTQEVILHPGFTGKAYKDIAIIKYKECKLLKISPSYL